MSSRFPPRFSPSNYDDVSEDNSPLSPPVTVTITDADRIDIQFNNNTSVTPSISVSDNDGTTINTDDWYLTKATGKEAPMPPGTYTSTYSSKATLLRVLIFPPGGGSVYPAVGALIQVSNTAFSVLYHFGGDDTFFGGNLEIPSDASGIIGLEAASQVSNIFKNSSLEDWKIAYQNDNEFGINWSKNWDNVSLSEATSIINVDSKDQISFDVNGGASLFKILIWDEKAKSTDQPIGGILIDAITYSVIDTTGTELSFSIGGNGVKKIKIKDQTPSPSPPSPKPPKIEWEMYLKWGLIAITIIILLIIFKRI